MTDSGMLSFTLRRLRACVVLLAPFAKLQRKFLRQVLTIFGGADKAPRLQALLFIRHMAAILPPPALELALKVWKPPKMSVWGCCRATCYAKENVVPFAKCCEGIVVPFAKCCDMCQNRFLWSLHDEGTTSAVADVCLSKVIKIGQNLSVHMA